jgi:glycolate oxidase iron-sulfur subunit
VQTRFTAAQLADADIRDADAILRACVHCGFCLATCPTYVQLGDELDSPRGRIYLIKDMLEGDRTPSAKVAGHIDRCLSCLSCMTTCPSGVDYMHLVDIARARIETRLVRPVGERFLRGMLAAVLPRPAVFRLALIAGALARPFRRLFPARWRAALALVPPRIVPLSSGDRPQTFPASGARRKRVAILPGCAQQILRPAINEAATRVLTRMGCEVVVPEGLACCGALVHHMGRSEDARVSARAVVRAFHDALDDGGLDAVVVTASGCGTMVKDYAHLLRGDAEFGARAAKIAALARDVSEVIDDLGLAGAAAGTVAPSLPVVAYHAACSLAHGQRIRETPARLLSSAGFVVREPVDAHLCCGSAGTYNMLRPELAEPLRARKAAALAELGADVIATGNIGCLTQLAGAAPVAVVHTVELLDWATGGPPPSELATHKRRARPRLGND